MRTYILKYNISNSMSLITRYLDFEILHHYFRYISNKVMYHILDNVKNVKKIYFSTQNMFATDTLLERYTNTFFSKNSVCSSEPLELIYSDFLELSILSYLKYKWMITLLDNYSFYCNIYLLHQKSKAAEAIKSIF